MSPGSLSLRKLHWMAAGAFDHTSQILCLLTNVNRKPGKRPSSPIEFNPFRKQAKKRTSVADRLREQIRNG